MCAKLITRPKTKNWFLSPPGRTADISDTSMPVIWNWFKEERTLCTWRKGSPMQMRAWLSTVQCNRFVSNGRYYCGSTVWCGVHLIIVFQLCGNPRWRCCLFNFVLSILCGKNMTKKCWNMSNLKLRIANQLNALIASSVKMSCLVKLSCCEVKALFCWGHTWLCNN